MSEIVFPGKPLTVNPIKVSQSMGAVLALLGLDRALPLQHGAQGCTAFNKVFFTRHFREPIPLQTTAMDQVVTVIGADQNVVDALNTVAVNDRPEIVGLMTTGLSEMQGADIHRSIKEFRVAHPEHDSMSIVPVNTPDTLGSLESGYALALQSIISTLVPEGRTAGHRPKQVNVLMSSMLTPGDAEVVREWIEAFGLHPLLLPDLGGSLDGHLDDGGYATVTKGGVSRDAIASMGKSAATLVIGASLCTAADTLKALTDVPDYRFDGLMGLEACDAFTQTLADIAVCPVPAGIGRQRLQLLDAMVDTHFVVGAGRVAIAGDADHLGMLTQFLAGVGCKLTAAVASSRAAILERLPLASVAVGDMEDLEDVVQEHGADVLVGNSHATQSAKRLAIPLLRAGFPQYDWYGGYARPWVGYRGSRQILFDLANLFAAARKEIEPHRSLYWQGTEREMASQHTPDIVL